MMQRLSTRTADFCRVIFFFSTIILLCPGAGPATGKNPPDGAESLATLAGRLARENPGLSGAYVLEKGEESLLARAWLADHAVRSIDIQYFIWSTDNIGILAAEALLRAADRGVKVRVIVDDLMIDAPAQSMLALANHPNIQIKIYNPKSTTGVSMPKKIYNLLTNFRAFNQRMHDKTVMVDAAVAITGGRNMADEYYDYDHEYNFRDRDVLLLGEVIDTMSESFERFWASRISVPVENLFYEYKRPGPEKTKEIYADLHRYARDPENFAPAVRQALAEIQGKIPALLTSLVWEEIAFLSDPPGKNDRRWSLGGGSRTTRRLTDALKTARKNITIQSPYLIMPKGGIEFFRELANRGVDIRISTNSLASTDNLYAFSGYSKQRKKILEAGIKIFEFKPRPAIQKDLMQRHEAMGKSTPTFALHAKTMVIDGATLFIGTFNLDPRSANLNTEVGILLTHPALATKVEQTIETDMQPENSWNASTDKPDRHASLIKRLRITLLKHLPIGSLL